MTDPVASEPAEPTTRQDGLIERARQLIDDEDAAFRMLSSLREAEDGAR
jgi:hypothetical protein